MQSFSLCLSVSLSSCHSSRVETLMQSLSSFLPSCHSSTSYLHMVS
jgi:hypothetical protein